MCWPPGALAGRLGNVLFSLLLAHSCCRPLLPVRYLFFRDMSSLSREHCRVVSFDLVASAHLGTSVFAWVDVGVYINQARSAGRIVFGREGRGSILCLLCPFVVQWLCVFLMPKNIISSDRVSGVGVSSRRLAVLSFHLALHLIWHSACGSGCLYGRVNKKEGLSANNCG